MLATFNTLGMASVVGAPIFGSEDPMGLTKFFSGAYRKLEKVRKGFIVMYNPGTHTALVQMMGTSSMWTCFFADEPLSYSYGFSATYPAREGDAVLVRQIAENGGVVIGRMPYRWTFDRDGDLYNDPDLYHRRLFLQNRDTWDYKIPGMMKPLENDKDSSTRAMTHFRPTDVYPGEFAHVNQHNCGIKGGMFSSTLLGGGASLRMSALSNLARLTCESYQRYSMLGAVHEFHNGRYLSSERNTALYQEERLGGATKGAQVWTEDAEAPKGGENQTMRPRVKELSGFFGHLTSKFCLRPDPSNVDIRVQGDGNHKEEGVFRETVDPSGQYRLSSAGMIAIERTGRIPVPVRKAYPTDNGNQMDKDPEKLTPFEHDGRDPGFRQLELFDRQAYDLKNQYSRVDGLGSDHKDYDVPEEKDLKPLQDEYDPKFFKNETVKLAKFDKRRAGMYIGEDGSVIIRDAWGSEIVMLGGNISMSCAGNIMVLPGQTALTIAGDDIVQKAQNSVDIHASAHDVRLSAAKNMEILGGADEDHPGGVVIESRGKSSGPWDGKDKGEDARVSGISLIAKDQSVVAYGKNLTLRSSKNTGIVSGDSGMSGSIFISSGDIYAKAKERAIVSSTGSAMSIYGRTASLCAEGSAIVSGKSSAIIISKNKVPGMWVDGAEAPDPEKLENLEDEENASLGFTSDSLGKMMFGFRKPQECRTDESWIIGGSAGEFRMYEPAWVQVAKTFDTLKSGGVDSEVYKEESKWGNGEPFPGKDVGEYAQLSGLKPENLSKDGGMNNPRSEVKNKSNVELVSLKDGYRIRK